MRPLATLSRAEFNLACQELVLKYSDDSQASSHAYKKSLYGWTWVEHTKVSGWGYLARTALSRAPAELPEKHIDSEDLMDEEFVELDDDSCILETGPDAYRLYLHESIAWHPTYMVPAYYFQAVDSSGSPAALAQVLSTDRFQHRAFRSSGIDITEAVVQPRENHNAQFPLLSQGDHPVLGTPQWYFHPCETSTAVKEILDQTPDVEWHQRSDAKLVLCWLEAWFAVLSTAIDLN